MQCSEKETLKQNCATAWNLYETAIQKLGLPMDTRTGTVIPHSRKELGALIAVIDKPPYRAAIALRTEQRKASAALSQHLCTHRC